MATDNNKEALTRYRNALEYIRDEISGVFNYAGDVNKTCDKMEKVMMKIIDTLSPPWPPTK